MNRKTPENFSHSYFESELAQNLPEKILDFHTHIWLPQQWFGYTPNAGAADLDNSAIGDRSKLDNLKYMTSRISYTAEELLADGQDAFPGCEYNAVAFGQPTPKVDNDLTNDYVRASAAKNGHIFPLRITGKALPTPIGKLRHEIETEGWYGYKVYLDWIGDEYPPLLVEDMLSTEQLALADEKGLVVLLHVPRRDRLADPEVGQSVRAAALRYPNAKFVIAHCGRCYRYEEIRRALHWVADLDNVWFDCSMAMDPTVLAYILQRKNPARMLFATDYPIAAMHGKRVNIGDHWVDVVLPGFPEAHYRVITDNMRATYMTHEIAKAVIIGAELAGFSPAQTREIFYENGMGLLQSVRK